MNKNYELAKEQYAAIGVDTEAAMERLSKIPISMHCWQGDDVLGFDGSDSLTGGIQTTGDYPGRARTPEELMADIDKALSLIPGKHRLNLHASYAIFEEGQSADRDKLKPEHFKKWVEFAKERGLGIDFNPTYFSHPLASNFTLSSPDEQIRKFWIEHGKACIKIGQYFAEELNTHCLVNIWIPDGYKNTPANRMAARKRLKDSLDEILSVDYDKTKVFPAVESKVFGIGLESCTVGSHEFYMNYAANKGILCLLDNGHYHPTEVVSDKISSMLLFYDKLALHVTHPVRWDSDHVVLLDDELKAIANEIIVNHADQRVMIGLDFFDASINRIAAWVTGMRNMEKALLASILLPQEELLAAQENGDYTELMVRLEEYKTYPFGIIWDEYCARNNTPIGTAWLQDVKKYEQDVLLKR